MTPGTKHQSGEVCEWSEARCDKRHRPLVWMIGTILGLMGLVATATGWTMASIRDATREADMVSRALIETNATTIQYRKNQEENSRELKVWLKAMAEKQDTMNTALQRLVVLQEQEKSKKP